MAHKLSRRRFLRQAGQMTAAAYISAFTATEIYTEAHAAQSLDSPRTLADFQREINPPPLAGPITPNLVMQSSIPLEVKIGQMVMVGFQGAALYENSAIIEDIRDRHLGGVFLFRRNVQSPQQLTALTETLQAASPIPLFIAIDQEGGRVSRLDRQFGLPANYSAQYLGYLDDAQVTDTFADSVAQALAQVGINFNLAPVVDLNVNPNNPVIGGVQRSFSANSESVTHHARTFIQAHRRHGVFSTLKHFPGHGSSTRDSHNGFVDVTSTWSENELEPYLSLIQANECDAIMTAHVFNANLDEELPATLSHPTITGILRERLGFDGVIMTDDMQMGAIQQYYDFETAIYLAIDAGVDILSIANSTAYRGAANTIAIIQRLVEEGKISEQRIDQSYRRIQRLKNKLA